MFTVIDLMRDLGFEPEAPLSWEIGAAVRDAYAARFGELPAKGLRPKTHGRGGSHCFATYPDGFREEAAGIVAARATEAQATARAQGELF